MTDGLGSIIKLHRNNIIQALLRETEEKLPIVPGNCSCHHLLAYSNHCSSASVSSLSHLLIFSHNHSGYQLLDQSKNSSNCQVDLPANEKASSALPYSCQPMRNIPRSRIGGGHGIAGAVSIISNHRLTQEQGNLIRGVIT